MAITNKTEEILAHRQTPETFNYLHGPKPRHYELAFAFRVLGQFIKGFRALHFVGPCITVFGSARFSEDHPYYQKARDIGRAIARQGFTTLTGGGPGIMEAANRGAMENGGRSIGVNITLPFEQTANPFMHKWITIRYFFVRKVLLLKYSYAFIIMPGGWGTMDEMFETLTLIQTGIIHHFPVVIIGTDYYQQLLTYLEFMVQQKTISPADLNYLFVTDEVDQAMAHINTYIDQNYIKATKRKPLWWLLEKV